MIYHKVIPAKLVVFDIPSKIIMKRQLKEVSKVPMRVFLIFVIVIASIIIVTFVCRLFKKKQQAEELRKSQELQQYTTQDYSEETHVQELMIESKDMKS